MGRRADRGVAGDARERVWGMGTSATPLPPAKMLQESDLASLAGEWQGTLRGVAAGDRFKDGLPTSE